MMLTMAVLVELIVTPRVTVVAMKMNNEIRAPLDGVVRSVHTQVGESVDQGALLVVLEAGEES